MIIDLLSYPFQERHEPILPLTPEYSLSLIALLSSHPEQGR